MIFNTKNCNNSTSDKIIWKKEKNDIYIYIYIYIYDLDLTIDMDM